MLSSLEKQYENNINCEFCEQKLFEVRCKKENAVLNIQIVWFDFVQVLSTFETKSEPIFTDFGNMNWNDTFTILFDQLSHRIDHCFEFLNSICANNLKQTKTFIEY